MSSIFNKNYINITYKNKKTKYPQQLCKYIIGTYNIKQQSKILDIGCGNGIITKAFEDLGMVSFGVDVSESSTELLNKEKIKNHNLEISPYPFNDNTFDFIFSKSVIEHLNNPEILIDEAFRMLKPNGIFICMTPSWKHSYKEAFYIDHTHITPFTRYSLETICELSGFKSDCKYFYQLPALWKNKWLIIFVKLLNLLNLPYRPFSKIKWPEQINTIIRFSKEPMLLCKSKKQ